MAAQRQAPAFVLDVGPSMRSHLAGATAAIKAVVERKVIHYHNDELALVLVGSESSDNHVYTGEGMDDESRQAYAHIQTTHGLLSSLSVGLDILQTLQSASTGPGGADLLCAIAVAIDLFKQRPSSRLKRRMVLITAGEEPAPELDADFIDGICAVCRELDIVLVMYTIGFGVDEEDGVGSGSAAQQASAAVLRAVRTALGEAHCEVRAVRTAGQIRERLRPREKKATSVYDGALELGPSLKLAVRVWTKVRHELLKPSFKPFSLVARAAEEEEEGGAGGGAGGSALVSAEADEPPDVRWHVLKEAFSHAHGDADERELAPDQIVKAFRYGSDLVPFGAVDLADLEWKSGEKCMQLLGFVDAAELPAHHRVGGVDVLTPAEGSAHAREALSALAYACKQAQRVMLVRFVPRKNAAPKVCACFPAAKLLADEGAYFFYLTELPSADDVRALGWGRAGARDAPTAEQRTAAGALIDAFELVAADPDDAAADAPVRELLRPKATPNPQLHHVYAAAVARALHPGSALPTPDAEAQGTLAPDPRLVSASAGVLGRFREACPTAKPAAGGGGGRKRALNVPWVDEDGGAGARAQAVARLQAAVEEEGEGAGRADRPAPQAARGAIRLSGTAVGAGGQLAPDYVRTVRLADPLPDFEAMMANRTTDLSGAALSQLRTVTLQLAASAREDEEDGRQAVACLRAMRAACVRVELPAEYNDTLRALEATDGDAAGHSSLWTAVCAQRAELLPISTDEVEGSDFSPARARAFLVPGGPSGAAYAADDLDDPTLGTFDGLEDGASRPGDADGSAAQAGGGGDEAVEDELE